MNRYRFSLTQMIWGKSKRTRRLKDKVVFIDGSSLMEAYNKVSEQYEDWEISMFWKVIG